MRKSSMIENIFDQNRYTYKTYLSERLSQLEEVPPNVNTRIPENKRNLEPSKGALVSRLRPVVEYTALSEILVGLVLMILLLFYAGDYDKLYGTEESELISLMTFAGSFFLVLNGLILIISLKLDSKKFMGSYILSSTILWFYLFVLSVLKIHFALLVIEKDTSNVVVPERFFFLSYACSFGVATMLGSVTHFVGNVAVVGYYNFNYVQTKLPSSGP
ncbi:hypothetical protein PYW08_008155 [Mythimna loreyi]|uniref:Uncharacterized protein n=1 Tax=Mythimna loreyi TaxID=667449 RepID=A0ACC2QEL0_9NEOP|nr:hypothetical protein PYW08_008155 [Mythimna loreyi]